jgi:hypothetical protein
VVQIDNHLTVICVSLGHMSVAELRDRLAEISSSIALQKKLLDDLECTRADIHR